jgi:hypothetical protein
VLRRVPPATVSAMALQISRIPESLDWLVMQGDELAFDLEFHVQTEDGEEGNRIDLGGLTAASHVKASPQQSRPSLIFTCTVLPQSGETLGQLHMRLSPEQTAKLTPGVPYVYDVQLTGDGTTRTYVRGTITAEPEATRA